MCAIPVVVYLLRWIHEAIHALVLRLLGVRGEWRMRLKIWPDIVAPDASRARRVAAALAPPIILYFAAVALPSAVLLRLLGERSVSSATIESVRADTPGEAAGLRAGDEIRAIGGVPVADGDAVRREVARYPDRAVAVEVRRDGSELSIEATPTRTPNGAMLGVVLRGRAEPIGFAEAVVGGLRTPLSLLASWFSTDVLRSDSHVVGPVGIMSAAGGSPSATRGMILVIAISNLVLGWLLLVLPLPTSGIWRAVRACLRG